MPRWVVTLISAIATFGLTVSGWWVFRGRALERPPDASGRPLNVLLVTWDAVRADRLGPWGAARPTTPWLDESVETAIVFERAYAPHPSSLVSHATMLTGLPPDTTGMGEDWLWLDGRLPTLAEHLAARGYDTYALVANPLLGDDTNVLQGFQDRVISHAPGYREMAEAAAAPPAPGDKSQELGPRWPGPEPEATWRDRFKNVAPLLVDELLGRLDDRDASTPFFAFVNFAEARLPRSPSARSRGTVIGEPGLINHGLSTDQSRRRRRRAERGRAYTSADLAALRGVYDATIRDLDRATAALFEGLKERDLLRSTVVVLTSDRGAPLGDHGLFLPGDTPWASLAHVPLVVWHPAREPERRSRPVSTRDLAGTVARLASVPLPEGTRGDWWDDPSPVVIGSANRLALVSGPHELLTEDDEVRVFDLVADPAESVPIDDPNLEGALVEQLEAWKAKVDTYDPAARDADDQPAVVRPRQAELRRYLESIAD